MTGVKTQSSNGTATAISLCMGLVRHTAEIALQQCPVCGVEVPPRKTYCSNACRQKWYRDNPILTTAKILKQQRREDRMKSKIERHIRGKANVVPGIMGLAHLMRRAYKKPVKKPEPFGSDLPRYPEPIPPTQSDSELENEIMKLQAKKAMISVAPPEFSEGGTGKYRTDRVGVTVVEPRTIARVKSVVNPDIPDYLMPVVLDVQMRRGSPWKSVKAMHDFERDCRDDRREYREFRRLLIDGTVSIAFPDDEPLFWREAPIRFVPLSSCSAMFPDDEPLFAEPKRTAELPVDTSDLPATVLPRSRRGDRKRLKVSKRSKWCKLCEGYCVGHRLVTAT
jgi:hypothetical protein